jgi:hypothetical protein
MALPPQDKTLECKNTRYLEWLDKLFAEVPEEFRHRGIRKWIAIYEWHKSERRVWRALGEYMTCRQAPAKTAALRRLEIAYELRMSAYMLAEDAHWPCTHLVLTPEMNLSKEVVDMFYRHPGFYPTRR